MQILHVVTATAESVKEPFTTQGYFLKMHLKYIIKVTHKEARYARRSNHRYGQSHHPLLVETGPKLTAHFYDRMFAHNPELKEIFNMSNQRNGDQREALFNAIAAYASNIDNLPALLPAVEKSPRNTPVSRSNRSSTTSWAAICWRPSMKCSARVRKSLMPGESLRRAGERLYRPRSRDLSAKRQ